MINNNDVRNNFRGVYIYGRPHRNKIPHRVEVKNNLITNNYAFDGHPQSPSAFRNFQLIKTSLGDGHGVSLLSVGEDMNIHHNYIFNTANGIQFESDYDFTKNIKVYKNLIINTFDDGIEPSGFCQNCSVHENHLRNSSQAIRLKIEDNEGNGPCMFIKMSSTIRIDTILLIMTFIQIKQRSSTIQQRQYPFIFTTIYF